MFKVALVVVALSAPYFQQPTRTTPPNRGTSRSRTAPAPKRPAAKPAAEPPAPASPPAASTSAPTSTATQASTPPPASAPKPDGWLIVVAGLVAALGGLQWWTMRLMGLRMQEGLARTQEAAEAASSGAAAAARALAASERAYLVARNWVLKPPTVGEIPEVEFVVENVGRTPARRTLVRGQIEVRDTPLAPIPTWREMEKSGGTLTIPPGGRPLSTLAGDAPITKDDLDRLRAKTSFLSIWGRVDYEDVLGAKQYVNFAWQLDFATGALTYDPVSDAYHEAT